MEHKILSTEKLKEVWDLDSYGAKADEIREKTGCQNPYQVIKNLKKTITRVNDGNIKALKKTYIEAAKAIIEEQKKAQLPKVEEQASPPGPNGNPLQSIDPDKYHKFDQDRYNKLTKAITDFENAISGFIYEEIAAQTSKINEENRVMREALEQAKIPNIITNLQKKFRG